MRALREWLAIELVSLALRVDASAALAFFLAAVDVAKQLAAEDGEATP